MTDNIITKALLARTVQDVDALEGLLSAALPGVRERDLGDNAVNWSSVSSPGDPGALLMERVTNMFDAVIVNVARDTQNPGWQSPREAVAELFQVPDGVENLTDAERAVLAEYASITLYDSDDSKRRPTIAFRDKGIGLTGDEMPETILSLHGSNKLDTPYLHGVFGKGGSSTSQYSDATVIVSRKQPDALAHGEQDRISVAVVRLMDTPMRRLEYFRYLVDEFNRVYSVLASEVPDFEPGTYVAHVGYHGDRLGTQNWDREGSIYAYAETILFKPTMPFSLRDARTGDANVRPLHRQNASVLAGLAGRLHRRKAEKIVESSNWTQIDVPGVGVARMRWWLFEDIDARRVRAAKGYVALFTTNGQVHHNWDQAKLVQLVPDKQRVAKSILIEVDCDRVDLKTRARIFDTFRTQTRQSPEARALESAVADQIKNDQDLREHEEKLVSEALKSSGDGVSAAFLRRLNQAISIKTSGVATIKSGTDTEATPPPADQVEDLYDEPTYFTGPESIVALVGNRSSIFMKANAVDGFVPLRGQVDVRPGADAPNFTFSIADLRKGRMRIGVMVDETATPGAYTLDLDLHWSTDDGLVKVITWTTKVEVVNEIKPREQKAQSPDVAAKGSVAFVWAKKAEFEGSDKVAGKLDQLPGSVLAQRVPGVYGPLKNMQSVPTIVLNEDFREWSQYYQRTVKAKSDTVAEARKERYAVAVGSATAVIWGYELELERKIREADDGGEGLLPPMTIEQRNRAVAQAARTAMILLPDFDKVFGGAGGE